MCLPFSETFDAVFNLFTSFGYFDNEADNLSTIKAIKEELNTYGFGVIDFLNVDYVIPNLVAENSKTEDGITFNLKRYVKDGYITKDITFTHENENYAYSEKVKALSLSNFQELFNEAGVTLLDVFGDYKLNPYKKDSSERLIMIFK